MGADVRQATGHHRHGVHACCHDIGPDRGTAALQRGPAAPGQAKFSHEQPVVFGFSVKPQLCGCGVGGLIEFVDDEKVTGLGEGGAGQQEPGAGGGDGL
jgi:hypothetical protein